MAKIRTVKHGRIKERYSPKMNAREKKHQRFVQDQSCFGCGAARSSAHHTLLNFEGKRWRRDHMYLLPVCQKCHQGSGGIHGIGSEPAWLASIGQTEVAAITYMRWLWEQSE